MSTQYSLFPSFLLNEIGFYQIPLPWLGSNDTLPLATRMETRLPWRPTRGSPDQNAASLNEGPAQGAPGPLRDIPPPRNTALGGQQVRSTEHNSDMINKSGG